MTKLVKVIIDRPISYKNEFGTVYPVNYGYIENMFSGDGEEQDAYTLSKHINEPINSFTGKVISVVKRHGDIEDKWIVSSANESYTIDEIYQQIKFIEQYFVVDIHLIT